MSAYYLLKWCNPATLQAGGFGDDSHPLAMLPQGYGAMVDAMSIEADLDVRLNTSVTSIDRAALENGGQIRLTVRDVGGAAENDCDDDDVEMCDVVALSGPITGGLGQVRIGQAS